ncbi:MAG: hypothetical protein ABSF40_14955 [Candidatus Acidiferrales bacterium]
MSLLPARIGETLVASSILNSLKTVISWLAILAGVVLGVLGLAELGLQPVLGLYRSRLASEWLLTLAIAFLGTTTLVASFVALRNRKRAGLIYFGGAAVVMLCALASRGDNPGDLTAAQAMPSILVVLGLFWLVTHMRGWPRVAPEWAWSRRMKLGVAGLGSLLLFVLVSVAAIAISVSWVNPGDCGSEGTPSLPRRGGEPAFVARVIHVDRFLGAVAVVQERFWGLSRFHKVVFLKEGRAGDEYFVDGRIEPGLLTRYVFPVIDMKCSESALLPDAKVELRLLRGSPHWDGVRIIGRVLKLRGKQPGNPPLPGVRVIITGPAGTTIAVTDQDGIYDVSGLASGRYSVRADVVDAFPAPGYSLCREHNEYPGAGLRPGDVWGCTLRVP